MKLKKSLLVLAIGLLAGCNNDNTAKDVSKYKEIEKDLENYAKEYFGNNGHLIPNEVGDRMKVSISNLYDGNYITEKIVDPETKKECDAYKTTVAIVKKDENKFEYEIHLDCEKYQTPQK